MDLNPTQQRQYILTCYFRTAGLSIRGVLKRPAGWVLRQKKKESLSDETHGWGHWEPDRLFEQTNGHMDTYRETDRQTE